MKTTSDSHSSRRQFATLDAMRGVASFIVFFRHIDLRFLAKFDSLSYLAVDFFFGLSGFVLAFAYEKKFECGLTPAAFIKQRLIRLLPLSLLALAIGATTFIASSAQLNHFGWIVAVSISVLFGIISFPGPHVLPGLSQHLFTFNAPSWSIFCELFVNVLYGLIFPFLTTKRLKIMAGFGVIAIIVTLLFFGTLDVGYSFANLLGGLARVIFSFFVGVLLFRIWSKKTKSYRVSPGILFAGFIVLLNIPIPQALQSLYSLLVVVLIFPILIFTAADSDPTHEHWRKVCVHLGALSYVVYIIQDPLRTAIKTMLSGHLGLNGNALTPLTGVLALIVFVFICEILERFYDRPVRAWLYQRFMVKPDMPPAIPNKA